MIEIDVTSSIPPPSLLGDSGFDIFLGWGVEEKIVSLEVGTFSLRDKVWLLERQLIFIK